MPLPKLLPCPHCDSNAFVGVFTYESGWRRVECAKCGRMGDCCGSMLEAARDWNRRVKEHEVAA